MKGRNESACRGRQPVAARQRFMLATLVPDNIDPLSPEKTGGAKYRSGSFCRFGSSLSSWMRRCEVTPLSLGLVLKSISTAFPALPFPYCRVAITCNPRNTPIPSTIPISSSSFSDDDTCSFWHAVGLEVGWTFNPCNKQSQFPRPAFLTMIPAACGMLRDLTSVGHSVLAIKSTVPMR